MLIKKLKSRNLKTLFTQFLSKNHIYTWVHHHV